MKLSVYNKFSSIPRIKNKIDLIPIFASKQYADYLKKTKNAKTLWFRSKSKNNYDFLIPFSIIKKGPFRKGRFQCSVIFLKETESKKLEKRFLNEIIKYIRNNKLCDWIEQSPNWAIFNEYPDGAIYAPFGTYRINLIEKTEEELFRLISSRTRSHIKKAQRDNKIIIKKNEECFDDAVKIINGTLSSAKIESFTKTKLDRINYFLRNNLDIYTAYFENEAHSSIIFFHSTYSSYGMYAGSKKDAVRGATLLLFWEAIRSSLKNEIKFFDFVGARINPNKDSKLFRIQQNKAQFGAQLKKGYLWKIIFNDRKHSIYRIYLHIRAIFKGIEFKEDIIEQERERLKMS